MFQNGTTRHINANRAPLFHAGEEIAHQDTQGAELQPDTYAPRTRLGIIAGLTVITWGAIIAGVGLVAGWWA